MAYISRDQESSENNVACSRGAAAPDAHTQRRLFAASAGYCQNPACNEILFVDLPSRNIHVAEMAHVYAAQDNGPRANPELAEAERGAFENLIVLCSNCHTMVDKAPDQHPDDLMFRWKRDHAAKLQALFGVREFPDRATAREVVQQVFEENRAIFDQYGPHIEDAEDPESGAAERWKRKMLTRVLPNNRKMLALLDRNRRLLAKDERANLELFRQHVDDLEARHLENAHDGGAKFPTAFADILRD